MITEAEVEAALLKVWPDEHWQDFEEATAQNCHSASLALVKSGLLGPSRVARGACRGVGGQHSWVVSGDDPRNVYEEEAVIVDITLWSYDSSQPKIWIGSMQEGLHRPHFWGSIMTFGCPPSGGGTEIALTPEQPWSIDAEIWMERFSMMAGGPLDARFWMTLFSHAPYGGWPSGEFTLAGWQTPIVRPLIPIDRVGMQTDINPEGLYLGAS